MARPRDHRLLLLLAASVAPLLSAPVARAQSPATAIAEQQFQEGKRLFDAGKVHEACEKFRASQDADPGLGTLLHLAQCHEKEGRTATAWAEYVDATAQAQSRGEKDREKYARTHAQALEGQIHRVVIDMRPRPEELEIKLDGVRFPPGSLGAPVPIDAGEHALEARAPKKKGWSNKVTFAANAATDKIDIPALADEARPTPAPVAPVTPPSRAEAPAPSSSGNAGKRWIGAGVGVAGLAMGVVSVLELVSASSHKKDSDAFAAQGDKASSDSAYGDAKTAQTLGFVLAGAGVVAAGVGGYLFATSFGSSAKGRRATLEIVPFATPQRSGGVAAIGTF
jgi:hypothetical protein